MKKRIWAVSSSVAGLLTVWFVLQLELTEKTAPFIGALVCAIALVFLVAIGWNWILEYEREQETEIVDLWEYNNAKKHK